MITFGQIKNTTLKLLDEYSSRGAIQAATKTADMKFKIQDITNQTIYDLASSTAKIPDVFHYPHNPIKNSLSDDTSSSKQHLPGIDFSITLTDAKSCFFEATGTGTIVLEQSSDNGLSYTAIETITTTGSDFTEYRRLITATSGNLVRLRFTGDYVYQFRNYILYPYTFPTADDVQQHRPWFEIALPTNYLDINNVFAKKDSRQYVPYVNYIITPDKKFSFNSYDYPMELLINYWRKPSLLAYSGVDATDDALNIDLSDDATLIVPWNVAGEVLKSEKQVAEGTILLNQYEVKKSNLITNKSAYVGQILDVSGW